MWHSIRELFGETLRDLRRSWRILAITDLAYKAIAFAVLTPAVTLLLYWLRSTTSYRVVADVDIARFFLTTPAGILTLILGGSLFAAITAVEATCLMAIGVGQSQGAILNARGALRFGAVNAGNVLRLTGHAVLRVLVGVLPFGLALGLVYLLLLRAHDIHYYLAQHPPQFWIALCLMALIAIVFALFLARTFARWAFAWALVVFEQVHPRRALGESAKRTAGSHALILLSLGAWAIFAIVLATTTAWLMAFLGRTIAPQLADSLVPLLLFLGAWTLVGFALTLLVGVVNFSLFTMLITRLYLRIGQRNAASMAPYAGESWRLSGRARLAVVTLAFLGATGVGLMAFLESREQNPVLIIAHRGSSAIAPENSLSAFRLAAEQRTDLVELDVQESADGEVLVAHDGDLMKLAGNPIHIWEGTAAALRAIDVGSYRDARFADERMPTLAEALAVCKGRCRVLVELKSYGHDQQLVERVIAVVEAAGMQKECIFMSLDHEMVRKLKALRPSWRVGILVAKAMGDLTELKADFLAVETRMASRELIRRAHDAGQDVFMWTTNDPAWMLVALGRGIDGIITDKPHVARQVAEFRTSMSETQRFLVALLIRFGASKQALESRDALRP